MRRARRSSREAGSSLQLGCSLSACFAPSACPHLCSFVAPLKLPILLVEKLPEGPRGDTPGDPSKDILARFWLFVTSTSPQVETPLIALALFECRMRNHPSIAVKTVGPAAFNRLLGERTHKPSSKPRQTSGVCHPGIAVVNGMPAALRGGAAAGAVFRHGLRLFGGAQQPASKED